MAHLSQNITLRKQMSVTYNSHAFLVLYSHNSSSLLPLLLYAILSRASNVARTDLYRSSSLLYDLTTRQRVAGYNYHYKQLEELQVWSRLESAVISWYFL